MKWIPLLVLSALATAAAAQQRTPLPIQQTLNDAVARERQAIVRYEAFAQQAEDEGYQGAASLFHACAMSEAVHLRRFTAEMKSRGLALPPDETHPVKPGTTGDNLNEAAAAEIAERDGAYHDAIDVCNANDCPGVATLFDLVRDCEIEHAGLCAAGGQNLDGMRTAKPYFVCQRCGYTTALKLSFCPLCRSTLQESDI